MVVYHLTAWDKPLDWAASSREVSLGFFKTRDGAEKRIKEFKKQKDWKHWWNEPVIHVVPLHE